MNDHERHYAHELSKMCKDERYKDNWNALRPMLSRVEKSGNVLSSEINMIKNLRARAKKHINV